MTGEMSHDDESLRSGGDHGDGYPVEVFPVDRHEMLISADQTIGNDKGGRDGVEGVPVLLRGAQVIYGVLSSSAVQRAAIRQKGLRLEFQQAVNDWMADEDEDEGASAADASGSNGKILDTTSSSLSPQFTRLCRKLKIDDLHFHDLRHYADPRVMPTTTTRHALRRGARGADLLLDAA